MVLKRLIGLVFIGALALSAPAAEIVVRSAPPHAERERRPLRPSRNHVWVSGYHRYNGSAYVWTPGVWEQPPRAHAHWIAHRWVHRHDGWVLVEGRWS